MPSAGLANNKKLYFQIIYGFILIQNNQKRKRKVEKIYKFPAYFFNFFYITPISSPIFPFFCGAQKALVKFFFLLTFNKSLTMDFTHVRHDHKSIWVNMVHQLFQCHDLLASHNAVKKQLVLAGVHSLSVDSGHAAIQFVHDFFGNLVRLAGNDIRLFLKFQTFDQAVRYLCYKINGDDGIKCFLHTEHIHTYKYDGSVNKLHNLGNGVMA